MYDCLLVRHVTIALSCIVCELFDVEYYCDFKMWVRGHSRSLKLVPFEKLGAVSYSPSIVTMAVSVSVCELFSVKGVVIGHWKWRRSIDYIHATFYWSAIVTIVLSCTIVRVRVCWKWLHLIDRIRDPNCMALSCIVCEILRLIGKKSRNFYAPPVFSRSDPVGILWKCLMLVKLEWLGYRMVKKLRRYVKPFSSDTGTSRTDGQICYININIACQYADAR